MQIAKADNTFNPTGSNKLFSLILTLLALGLVAYLVYLAFSTPSAISEPVTISPSVLEQRYGLRVSLIAVTAAGGFVDFRMRVLDAAKARQLLQDPKNFPALFVTEGGVTLQVPANAQPDALKLEDDGNLFLMFPNRANAVKPGSAVTVKFGTVSLEPIVVK